MIIYGEGTLSINGKPVGQVRSVRLAPAEEPPGWRRFIPGLMAIAGPTTITVKVPAKLLTVDVTPERP